MNPGPADELQDWERLDDEGFFGLIGPLFHQLVGQGISRFRFPTGDRHRNRNGTIHGGLLLALADRTMGLTARAADRHQRHATVQLDMHFIDAVQIGAVVEIECQVVTARQSMTFLQSVMTADGRTIATGKGIWRNFSDKPAT